ncbi:MAG: transcription-repair coupling factor, partial [Pseudomonadota bacterium]|nr:transcription-repair coupling factor [Pseudomonadota bacterium]
YIAASATELNEIEDNIRFFADQAIPVLRFSDWETLPYDSFSPHQDIISDRLNTLAQIRDLSAGIVLTTTSSALTRICPEEHIDAQRFEIVLEQKIDQKQLVDRLTNGGYLNVETVNTHGEFAVRGAIMDVFPMGVEHPIRVEWFDDEIESIRWFDVDSQRTIEKVTEIKILPAREIATTQHGITGFRKRFRERFDIDPLSSPIYQDVSEGIIPGGIEYYLPLFFDQTGTLFDYLSKDTLIARNEQINEYVGATLLDYKTRHESLAYDIQKPILKPSELCLIEDEFFAKLNQHPGVIFVNIRDSESLLPNLATDPQNRSSFDKLSDFIEQQNNTLIVAE